jgi:ligand-binding SRPBCC domain-containing protein
MPTRLTHLDTLRTNPVLQQRLATYLVLQCVRHSRLEDLHAGIAPSSATGDYADVTVTSPFGTIPWPRLSRFNDDEMKQLMIDIVDRTYQFPPHAPR